MNMTAIWVAALMAWSASASAQLSRLDYTPLLLQEGFGPHGEYLPNDGAEYCVPTSFTMAMYWLRANGLTRIAPRLSKANALDTDLAVAGFYQTTPDGGTGATNTISNGTPKLLTYLALRGITGVEVKRHSKPDYATVRESVSGLNIGVINIVWLNEQTLERNGGHDVVVVTTGVNGQGQPAPNVVGILNPMSPHPQFVPTYTLGGNMGAFSGYLAFDSGYLSKPGVIPVIDGVTILTPDSFQQPLTAFRLANNLVLSATGGSMDILAPLVGEKGITKSGASTVVFAPSSRSSYRGPTRLLGGSLVTQRAAGPALGRGDIRMHGGSLIVAPRGRGRAAPVLGAKGGEFLVGGGTLQLRRGTSAALTATIAGSFHRAKMGSLVLVASRGLDQLGDTEALVLTGPVGESLIDRNGMVTPAIVGQDGAGSGDFLRYDAGGGFRRAQIAGIESDRLLPAGQTLAATRLRVDNARVQGEGTLRMEGAVAGLILNGGAIETTRLVLDATETVCFAGSSGGRIASRIEGIGSLIVNGPGSLRLASGSRYAGTTIIDGATLIASNLDGSATGEGRVVVRPGGTLSGNGRIGGNVQVDGAVRPGEQGGVLHVDGRVDFANQAVFDWRLAALSDAAGRGDWGRLEVGGDLVFSAGGGRQFEILKLNFPKGKNPDRALPFWRQAHRWTIARSGGTLNASGLAIQNPRYEAGQFAVSVAGSELVLVYTPAAPTKE